jgi:hypothetical protein
VAEGDGRLSDPPAGRIERTSVGLAALASSADGRNPATERDGAMDDGGCDARVRAERLVPPPGKRSAVPPPPGKRSAVPAISAGSDESDRTVLTGVPPCTTLRLDRRGPDPAVATARAALSLCVPWVCSAPARGKVPSAPALEGEQSGAVAALSIPGVSASTSADFRSAAHATPAGAARPCSSEGRERPKGGSCTETRILCPRLN